MKPISKGRSVKQRGSYMVEYSFVILTFLFVLFGIMEFGRIVAAYNILAGATREGSRFAMVHGSRGAAALTQSQIQDLVQNEVRKWCIGLDSSAVNVTTTWPSGTNPGRPVTVASSYTVIPILRVIGGSMTLSSQSQMVISY